MQYEVKYLGDGGNLFRTPYSYMIVKDRKWLIHYDR